MLKRRLVLSLILVALKWSSLLAQDDWELEGDVEDAEIVIEKDRQITLPPAQRIHEKVPPLPEDEGPRAQSYEFKNFRLVLPPLNPSIRILTMKPQPLSKLYGNYVKAGYGNYQTPYLEAFLNNKRDEDYSVGLHFRHLSSAKGPVDEKNSGNGETSIGVNGETFSGNTRFQGGLSFARQTYHFYGYDRNLSVERDSIQQVFDRFGLVLGLASIEAKGGNQFAMGLSFDYLDDDWEARELELGLRPEMKFKLSESMGLHVDTEARISRKEDALSSFNRHYVALRPYVSIKKSQMNLKIGGNVVWENDTIQGGDKVHLYPVAKIDYALGSAISAYGEVKGDMQRMTLNALSMENPYLDRIVGVFNTNQAISVAGGIKGAVGGSLAYKVGLQWADYRNMYFFANSSTDSTRFEILFDRGHTSVFNFIAELQLSKGKVFRNVLLGEYYSYDTDDLLEAWHKPTFKLSNLSTYNLYNKLLFNMDLYLLGGIKGLNLQSGTRTDLDTIIDLNLKADYLISERASVFVAGENILSREYESYLNYPTRGLRVLAGVTVSF